MKKESRVMLGNIDYRTHVTNEGDELQQGMMHAGWHISGVGFDGLQDVKEIVKRYDPDIVLVHDKRDWDASNPGCFRKSIGFRNLDILHYSSIYKAGVVKDAGGTQEYHEAFLREIGAQAAVTYYHDNAVLPLSPFLEKYKRIRTYHSIDANYCMKNFVPRFGERKNAIVSGAVSSVYPLRRKVFDFRKMLGCDALPHPGYNNRGTLTSSYLKTIGGYKVSIATASSFNFALRKIIESVAMGATTITNLPTWDILPEIDGALIRIPSDITLDRLQWTIKEAVAAYDWDENLKWADKAWSFYDWRAVGLRLSNLIGEAANGK